MKKIIVLLFLLLLVACQNNDKTLDVQNLEVDENANNEEVKHYKAKSLEIAISSLPFELELPKEIPDTFNRFQLVFITDWNDTEDGKDIAIEVRATSQINESVIGVYARDFDMSILDPFKESGEKLTLENKQEVYFTPLNPPLAEWHGGNVSWVNDNIFYGVQYAGSDLNVEEVKQILFDLVHQMQ